MNDLEVEDFSIFHTFGNVYFATREDAQHAIDTLGDRLNVLFE